MILALLAAACNAVSSVLQRRASAQVPGRDAFSLQLIGRLLRCRAWHLGILTLILGFVLQATALSQASLTLVEPLLIAELPLTILFAATIIGGRVAQREWAAVAAVTAGLVGLMLAADPAGASARSVPLWRWGVCALATGGLLGLLVLVAMHSQSNVRPACLGAAAGIGFGFTAALIKAATIRLQLGPLALLSSWTPYALVASGLGSLLLFNNAVHTGRLVAVQPGVTLCDPLVSALIGVALFDERWRTGLLLLPELFAVALIAIGTSVLVSSSHLSNRTAQPANEQERSSRRARTFERLRALAGYRGDG